MTDKPSFKEFLVDDLIPDMWQRVTDPTVRLWLCELSLKCLTTEPLFENEEERAAFSQRLRQIDPTARQREAEFIAQSIVNLRLG